MISNSLKNLYYQHAGKLSDKWEIYLSVYQVIFHSFQGKEIAYLEIGTQNGGSLEIFAQYFEHARVLIGCDINEDCRKLHYNDPRISIIIGDAATPAVKEEILNISNNFDIIIDDGSHRSSDIVKNFILYFGALNDEGIYIAEDLHCSYWQEFEGGLSDPYSSLSFFKKLVDIINYEHWGVDNKKQDSMLQGILEKYNITLPLTVNLLETIHSIEFANSLCIIRKKTDASKNRLGERRIVGNSAEVLPILLTDRGKFGAMVCNQNGNPWSVLNHYADEEYLSQVEANAIAQEKIKTLASEINSLKERSNQLKTKVLTNEAIIIDYTEKIRDIYLSKSWRITAPLRSISTLMSLKLPLFMKKTIARTKRISPILINPTLFFKFIKIRQRKEFDTQAYLDANPDVASSGMNPLVHYLVYGLKEDRALIPKLESMDIGSSTKLDKESVLALRSRYTPLSSVDLSKYDVIFFDVFDTAILRLFQKPTDLFEYIGYQKGDSPFREDRVQKEMDTRAQYHTLKDISLEQIYEHFEPHDINFEIEIEKDFCIENPEVYQFYKRAIDEGKKIYFISDMYLPKKVIEEILHKNHYLQYDGLYVSSEDNLTKGDGSRFVEMQKILPESPQRTLHIGDNIIADFKQAQANGYEAIHYIENDNYLKQDDFMYTYINHLNAHSSLGLSFILSSFRYWKQKQTTPVDHWEQFGFLFGGALISSFCHFIQDYIQENDPQCKRLFFLARDGDIINKVYNLLCADIETTYLYASRRCMTFPTIDNILAREKGENSFIKLYTMSNDVESYHDLIDRLGYDDLEALKSDLQALEEHYINTDGHWTEEDIFNCFIDNKESIIEKAQNEQKTLLGYLESQHFFDQENTIIIDVGWAGTIHDALNKLIQTNHKRCHLKGIYLGINDNVNFKEDKVSFLFKDNNSEFAHYLNLIELITSSPQSGVIRVDQIGNEYVAVNNNDGAEELKRQKISLQIQKGILAFAALLKERNIEDLSFINPHDFKLLFDSLKTHPNEEDISLFNDLKHAMLLGNQYNQKVLDFNS